MDLRDAQTERFRAHATARFRGDAAEAKRLMASIRPEQRMAHLLFQLTLFAQVFVDAYGDSPDPGDLAELTKRLHDKHFRADSNFNALKAEAMVRAICGESILLTEIPVAEQPGYMWTVMHELIGPDCTDEDLAERFEVAEEAGLEMLGEAYEATIRNHPRRTAPDAPTQQPPATVNEAPGQRPPEPASQAVERNGTPDTDTLGEETE